MVGSGRCGHIWNTWNNSLQIRVGKKERWCLYTLTPWPLLLLGYNFGQPLWKWGLLARILSLFMWPPSTSEIQIWLYKTQRTTSHPCYIWVHVVLLHCCYKLTTGQNTSIMPLSEPRCCTCCQSAWVSHPAVHLTGGWRIMIDHSMPSFVSCVNFNIHRTSRTMIWCQGYKSRALPLMSMLTNTCKVQLANSIILCHTHVTTNRRKRALNTSYSVGTIDTYSRVRVATKRQEARTCMSSSDPSTWTIINTLALSDCETSRFWEPSSSTLDA